MGVLHWFTKLVGREKPQPENSACEKTKELVVVNPLSPERAEFVKDRIRVLSAMYTELLQRPAKYIVGQHELHRMALSNIQAEKLQLTVELDVLTMHLKESTHE